MDKRYRNQYLQAGLLIRRQLRTRLLLDGIAFSEPQKGFFIIEESPAVYHGILCSLRRQGWMR